MLKRKLQKGRKYLQQILASEHKALPVIIIELFSWRIFRKGRIVYYLDYQIYLRGRKMSEYLSQGEFDHINKKYNTPEYHTILEDKYFFYKILEGNGFRSPRNIYLLDSMGIYDLEGKTYLDKKTFLQRDMDGFCKIINGYGGSEIYQISVSGGELFLNKEAITLEKFLEVLDKRKYMVQDRISQHPEMNRLNPSCVNTIRMLTLKRGKEILLFQDYLRVGINNSYVDNGLSGNIVVGILEDGSLMERASIAADLNQTMEKHPQTGVYFKDFKIPDYENAVEMVKSLHELYQQFFMIGWDIALTPEGPLVIEGNNIADLTSYQYLYGGSRSALWEAARTYRQNYPI